MNRIGPRVFDCLEGIPKSETSALEKAGKSSTIGASPTALLP